MFSVDHQFDSVVRVLHRPACGVRPTNSLHYIASMPPKATDPFLTLEIIEVMEAFLLRNRPPKEIRSKLDIAYRVEGRDVYIYEVRPRWEPSAGPERKVPLTYQQIQRREIRKVKRTGLSGNFVECNIAKATYIKSHNHWRVFWTPATNKWERYLVEPIAITLEEFVKLVEEDRFGAFWG